MLTGRCKSVMWASACAGNVTAYGTVNNWWKSGLAMIKIFCSPEERRIQTRNIIAMKALWKSSPTSHFGSSPPFKQTAKKRFLILIWSYFQQKSLADSARKHLEPDISTAQEQARCKKYSAEYTARRRLYCGRVILSPFNSVAEESSQPPPRPQ